LRKWPKAKVLVISHVSEILKQNFEAIKKQIDFVDIGLYSAGLGKKTVNQVTIAGIQSVRKKVYLFGGFDIVLVDEAQSVSFDKNSVYRKFLDELNKRTVGLTATPFRLKGGYLHTGIDAYFHSIVYEIGMKFLIKEGKLSEIRTKKTKNTLNASKIKKQAGDFVVKDLASAFDRVEITRNIVQELLKYKNQRKKWLGFGIDIKHVENITDELNRNGINSRFIHSKMKNRKIKENIRAYRAREFQVLTSVAMVTTGFDVADIDLVFCLRPTASPVLHVQIPGRGMRVFPGKTDCLYLDFAGNLKRNGPLDAPFVNDESLKKKKGEALMKECPVCFELVAVAVKICPDCGEEFKFKHHLTAAAASIDVMTVDSWHKINKINYKVLKNRNNIFYLQVEYQCGLRRFTEPVCFEHTGYPQLKARQWWSNRWFDLAKGNTDFYTDFVPKNCQTALKASIYLKEPSEILVAEGGKYPRIEQYIF